MCPGCACWDGFVRERDITLRVDPVTADLRLFLLDRDAPQEITQTNGAFHFQTPSLSAGGYHFHLFKTTQVHGGDSPFLRVETGGHEKIMSIKDIWRLSKDRNGISTLKLQGKMYTQQQGCGYSPPAARSTQPIP